MKVRGVSAGAESNPYVGEVAIVKVEFGPDIAYAVFLSQHPHYRIPYVDAGGCLVEKRIFHFRRGFEQGRVYIFPASHGVYGDGIAVCVNRGYQTGGVYALFFLYCRDFVRVGRRGRGDASLGRESCR